MVTTKQVFGSGLIYFQLKFFFSYCSFLMQSNSKDTQFVDKKEILLENLYFKKNCTQNYSINSIELYSCLVYTQVWSFQQYNAVIYLSVYFTFALQCLTKMNAGVLCILTSFWVLHALKRWSNYFFSRFQPFLLYFNGL